MEWRILLRAYGLYGNVFGLDEFLIQEKGISILVLHLF